MISKAQAMAATHGTIFYHVRIKNADGTPARCRVNGKCKVWITRPNDWALPVKHGLKDCFHITPGNEKDWAISECATVVEGA